jgi:nickel/cobalt exporter
MLALGLVVLTAAPAAAHPLGLPAFAQVSATGDRVTVLWNAAPDDVAALARSLGVGTTGALTREQDAALAASAQLRERVLREVTATQDGAACTGAFRPPASVVTQGLRVELSCPRPVDRVRLRISLLHDVDDRYRTLAGHTGPDGTERTMFSSAEPEHELRLDQAAQAPAAVTTRTRDVQGTFGGALPLERRFVAAIDSTPGVAAGLLALLVAFAVGALHALAPGHCKAVAAGYLIGERARLRHAAVLGGTVALMHTGSVLALGLALFSATRAPDAARLSATIGLVTGLVFFALGLWLLARRSRTGHHHREHHEPHEQPGPLSLQGVVALGAAGGLLPSPSALLVLLTALAVDRVAYGLTLIAAFSLGLATTVTLVGVAVLRGRDVLHDRGGARLHRLVHAAPLVGAAAVTLVGAGVATRAALSL